MHDRSKCAWLWRSVSDDNRTTFPRPFGKAQGPPFESLRDLNAAVTLNLIQGLYKQKCNLQQIPKFQNQNHEFVRLPSTAKN